MKMENQVRKKQKFQVESFEGRNKECAGKVRLKEQINFLFLSFSSTVLTVGNSSLSEIQTHLLQAEIKRKSRRLFSFPGLLLLRLHICFRTSMKLGGKGGACWDV